MEVDAFINCELVVTASSQSSHSISSEATDRDAAPDYRSLVSVLVIDPEFASFSFAEPPSTLTYPFTVSILCGETSVSTFNISTTEDLLEIPEFLASCTFPPLFSASERIPSSLVQFAGARGLSLLLLRPDVSGEDAEIAARNFRSKFLVIQSRATVSELPHKITLIDLVGNFRRTTDTSGEALRLWLATDHVKEVDMELAGMLALIFIFCFLCRRLVPVVGRVRRFLVPLTSLALVFVNLRPEGCGCCAGIVSCGCR